MAIVGTAGHVDHGKSTLVRALTGQEPDRWREEQERGLTIDLGFAWTELEPGVAVGFVDVPGHERFIKNMLAGTGGIDVALLVVAADEGWMPQTEEHAAVLDLIGVTRGVVALTRIDLVDEETADIAELEVGDRLSGLSLEGMPVVRVAAPAGVGIGDLRSALAEAVASVPAADPAGTPRLWVDRVFAIAGAGTVVTGTLVGGAIDVGDEVETLPDGQRWRVRQAQSHDRQIDTALPGSRVALNLTGGDREAIGRGTLVGPAGAWRTTTRFVASIRGVRSHPDPPTDRGAYRLHLGSASTPARVRLLEDDLVAISADEPIAVSAGDRFILRDVGRRAVVAGGVVLDPRPGPGPVRGSYLNRLRAASGPEELAAVFLSRRRIAAAEEILAETGAVPRDALHAGSLLVDPVIARDLREDLRSRAVRFHEENPRRPGLPVATAASALEVPPEVVSALCELDEELTVEEGVIRSRTASGPWDEAAEAAWARIRNALGASLAVPRASSLGEDAEIIRLAVRTGRAVEIADDVVYLPEQLARIVEIATELADPGFTVADLRDRLDVSRRHAVPLVEWLDATGVTRRSGDLRVLRR